jgi:hypothetical protein
MPSSREKSWIDWSKTKKTHGDMGFEGGFRVGGTNVALGD